MSFDGPWGAEHNGDNNDDDDFDDDVYGGDDDEGSGQLRIWKV